MRVFALPLALALAACGGSSTTTGPTTPTADPAYPPDSIPAQVVAEFERTTLAGPDAWITLFDFTAIGEFEILLHRYDLLGRLEISDELRTAYAREDGTPYPPERERKNVGNFYKLLAQRTVGTGGCVPVTPKFPYNRLMGKPFEPLPPDHQSHEALRVKVNAYLENGKGDVVAIRCAGGKGGLALVWSRKDTERGWDIITIYDDGSE
jgi:hypothetical protein